MKPKETLQEYFDRVNKDVPEVDYRVLLEIRLEAFKQACLAKYDKGRREHGDTLSELDFDAEIMDEYIDIINYFLLKEIVKKI